MAFEIVTRNEFDEWTQDAEETSRYIGGAATDNQFDSADEAWAGIEQLRQIGPEWAAAEFDVREVAA